VRDEIIMRITIVIGGLGGGGGERVCVNLANAWVAGGHRVTLLTITQRSRESVYPLDPQVKRRDVGWPRESRADEDPAPILDTLRQEGCGELAGEIHLMAALRVAILDTAPDVVISHMDLTSVRVLAALNDTGIPVIACEHTDPNRVSLGAWQRAREVFYRRAGAVVASHAATTEWLSRRGITARTIPNPLVPPPRRAPLRRARRRIVTLGRLSPEKRPEMLIRAFARIADDLPQWDLEIHGDGPLHDELAKVIAQLGLGGRVSLPGFTNDPYAALMDADLYVSASTVEGFGNAIWEALACGVPVVAMDCGAPVRTLVRDGIDGRIVIGSEHALSVALADVMSDDEARKALASRTAEVLTRFSIESALRKWDVVLNEVAWMKGVGSA
jgi:GalNAc-alpha-(1->4)-GalNAc-alpha-(1->3)-diNAcBac-PP-undecaprenol alpha-1,4-N-acetyl-D-galactosaminyltransferase